MAKQHWATPETEHGEGHRDPKRNQGNIIVEVFDQPERAKTKEESDHPELWEPNYVWRPAKAYRPDDPMDPYVPAMELDPATRPETMKLAKMMIDRIPKKLGIQKITAADPECWGLLSVFTEETAYIANHMGIRNPMTMAQIAEACGIKNKAIVEK